MLVEQNLTVLVCEKWPQFRSFDDSIEAVDQISLQFLTAFPLPDQIDDMLEQPLTISLSEHRRPSLALLAVLQVVGIQREKLEIYPCCHFLVFQREGVGIDIEYGLCEKDPFIQCVEVAQVVGDLDVEGRIECLEGLVEQLCSLFVEVLKDLSHYALQLREVVAHKLFKNNTVFASGVLVRLGNLPHEVDRCHDAALNVTVQ